MTLLALSTICQCKLSVPANRNRKFKSLYHQSYPLFDFWNACLSACFHAHAASADFVFDNWLSANVIQGLRYNHYHLCVRPLIRFCARNVHTVQSTYTVSIYSMIRFISMFKQTHEYLSFAYVHCAVVVGLIIPHFIILEWLFGTDYSICLDCVYTVQRTE